ncbi:MAG: hypothetical protein ABIX28_13490 [Vicinamibacterales bacterium]
MAELDPRSAAGDPDERGGAAEDAAIDAIAALLQASVRDSTPPGAVARRDAHPKHHAIVRAEFRVDPDVPAGLRHGIFATPHAFPAWIRLSNGAPRIQGDRQRDQRGLAI